MSGGSLTWAARCGSSIQALGRYSRQLSGQLALAPLQCKLTATWQFATWPRVPQYCRATPTECTPALGKAVSSMIHTSEGLSSSTTSAPNAVARPQQPRGFAPQTAAGLAHRPQRCG